MLSYYFTGLNFKEYSKLSAEDFDNIYELFSEILILGLSKQIKQGLFKDYIDVSEATSTVHGKINITESIKPQNIINKKIQCSYDEFSFNSYFNKIIKTTLTILLKADITDLRKHKIKNIIFYFRDVDVVDINEINWKIRYDRSNQTYRLLIGICYLIINGLMQSETEGEHKLMKFFDDARMSTLYEKFILNYYIKEHPEIKTHSPKIEWQLDDEEDYLLPKMQTDVTLEYENKILIIDAKFYSKIISGRFSDTVRSAHLYQIFTYVKNKEIELSNQDHEIAGMLLYAGTKEKIQPDVSYKMSGNEISVNTLDLYCDNFKDIKNQLDKIVENYFGIISD